MAITRRKYLQASGGLAALSAAGLALPAWAQADAPDLPKTMIWSTYDVGSTGYVEASAVADAFGQKYGTRVRLQPSGSSIGRLQPILRGRVPLGWLANEVFFASEGLYEFCTPELGPQDVRTLMGRPSSYAIAVTKKSGIKTAQDLKGKRLAYAEANTSVNVKNDAILAFGGLTLDDVELVRVASYGASLKALVEGRADAAGASPSAATMFELESSPNGLGWVPMPADDAEGWARAAAAVPFVEPIMETVGAGMSEDNPVPILGYRYPMLTVRGDADPDWAYAMVKAVDGSFDVFKDASKVMTRWSVKEAGTPPMDAALHEGAIRYYKELGQWGDEQQAWQDSMLERHTKLLEAWQQLIGSDAAKAADEDGLRELWDEERKKVLASL